MKLRRGQKEFMVKQLVSIYDGDTITIDIDLGFYISIRKTCRLKRVNTPEIRKKEPGAEECREWLKTLLTGAKKIKIWTSKSSRGKYGRHMVELFCDRGNGWENVSNMIIAQGYPN